MIQNSFEPFAPRQCRIEGPVAECMERFFNGRLRSKKAREVVYHEAEEAFRTKLDDAKKVVGIWQGEFWGKWMLGAVGLCRSSGDPEWTAFVRQCVDELLTMQRPDGYLGTYRDSEFWNAAPPEETKKILGWECDWNWNIWCSKYTLWALLECADFFKDAKILDAAKRMADQLIGALHAKGVAIRETGTFFGLASGSILKPMMLLHKLTGEQRYLDFAGEIVRDWERPDGAPCNIVGNALSGVPLHLWKPEREKPWQKAYEMMSCADGLLDYYRVTGEQRYLDAVVKLRKLLVENETNAVASVGYNDQFHHAAAYLNAISEPCDAIHWMRLNFELFTLTGDIGCLDSFEATFYNAFLAGAFRDGEWGARGVRSSGRHQVALVQAELHHNHCCVNNMPRGFQNAEQTFVLKAEDAIIINLYSEVRGNFPGVEVAIGEGYLTTGRVRVTVTAEKPLTVRFRIPGWCKQATVAGAEVEEGRFHSVQLPAGTSEIELDFHPSVTLTEVSGINPEELDAWSIRRLCFDQKASSVQPEKLPSGKHCLLQWGPLLLARSKFIGNSEEEMFQAPSLAGGNWSCKLTPRPGDQRARYVFDAEFTSPGATFTTVVCDYASAGDAILEDDSFFNLFF